MAAEEVPGVVPPSINCHQCNAVIDLTGQSAFTHVDCTQCGALSVVPLQFGNFLLLNPLGVGGMGTVYKAIDLALNRFLALKILRKKLAAKPEFIENFSKEARAAAAVNHPNIAQVYSFGEHQGQYYLAMELLERGSLDDRISTLGKLPEKDVLDIGWQVAAGLRAAEQRDLLHRDIKPGNILFNDESMPKIVDFGLARASNETRAANEPIWGTPYYIAPEKLRGHVEDVRSDIYSLGATLFHALAGRPPFDAATASEVVTKHATQPALSLRTYAPDIQQFTAHVIGRALSKNPAERYQTYDEMIHDLGEAVANLKLAQSQKTVVAAGGERIPVTSVIISLAGLLVCAAVIWFVWAYRGRFFPTDTGSNGAINFPPPPVKTNAAPVAESPELQKVNFNENEPWAKAWAAGIDELAHGHYQEALQAYDSAKRLAGPNRPRVRQWLQFVEGLTLLAADHPTMSVNSFAKGIDPGAVRGVPSEVTPTTFVDPLLMVMMNGLPLAELEQAVPRLPPWAAALVQLCAGFKHLEAGELGPAAESFHRYVAVPSSGDERWAFSLQSQAGKLAGDCEHALTALKEIDQLQADGKLEQANDRLQQAIHDSSLSTITAVLEKRAALLKPALADLGKEREQQKAEAEKRRQEAAAQEKERAAEETKFLQSIDPQIIPFLQKYDFRGAHEKYRELGANISTPLGRQMLQSRLDAADRLVQFKQQLLADIGRQAYPGGQLRSKNNEPVTGNLTKASETELFFSTQYGELVQAWTEFVPGELLKLGGYYASTFAPSESAEAQANRYLQLALFSKQYGLDKAVESYSQKAVQLQPAIDAELKRLIGKTTP